MARVTITLEDETNGNGIKLKVESDPAFPGTAAENPTYTQAQKMALSWAAAIVDASKGNYTVNGRCENGG